VTPFSPQGKEKDGESQQGKKKGNGVFTQSRPTMVKHLAEIAADGQRRFGDERTKQRGKKRHERGRETLTVIFQKDLNFA